jgi:Zn-dependent oligopeptidase
VTRASILSLILAAQAIPAAAATSVSVPNDAASLMATCASAVGELNSRVAAVAARSGGFTFGNTVLPLENAVADAVDKVAVERFAWTVAQDDAIVDASRECRMSLREATIDVLASRRLYAAVARIANHPPRGAFDRALTAAWAGRLRQGGGGASGARHERYVRDARELIGIEDAFWRDLARDRTTIRIERRQARGLPPDLVAAFARNRDGSFLVPVDEGTRSFLRFEDDSDAREAFYRAFNRRAADANVPLLQRAIALRDRMAHALDVETWAEYRLRATALRGYSGAQRFLGAAATAYAPGRPPNGIAPWNLRHSDDDPVPAPRSLDDALAAVGKAFGLHLTRRAETAWASGVARYDVADESSRRPLGSMYVDLARRPGKQTSEGAYAILAPRGTRAGIVAIVASWPGSSGIVSGDRLVDFYRLSGRAIALLLPAVPYETLACISPEAEETIGALFERFARAGPPPARALLEQTAIAQIDLVFSSSGSHVDTSAVWQRVVAATFAPLYDPGTYRQVASEDFIDGEAGLLALRPWSQTYAADLYGRLAIDGTFDPSAGERFRRIVLAAGAVRRFEDEMRDFLGRDPRSVMP